MERDLNHILHRHTASDEIKFPEVYKMNLIKLWEADLRKAYKLQNSFARNERGFLNNACGLSFAGFQEYVRKNEGYSNGIGLPEGYVPALLRNTGRKQFHI